MSDDLRRRLEEAGRRPVPGPDQAFAEGLEARLLAVAVSLPPAAPQPQRRTRLRLLLGGTLVAGAAVALVIAIGAGSGRPVAPPQLQAPVNTEVALVDGTVLEDPDGLQLPEGAVVSVGEGGSARVGDTLLLPGDVATVERGRLRVEHGQPVGTITAGRPTPNPTRTPGPSRRPSPGPTRTPGPTPRPSQRPVATPSQTATPAPAHASPNPTPTRVPATPAPTRPSPPATPAPTRPTPPPTTQPTTEPTTEPSATPTASPTVIRPRLRARFVAPDGIRVTWTAVPGASSYVIVATGAEVVPAPRPRYPGGRVIGEFTQVPEVPLRFRVPDGTVEVRLLVAALAPDGAVISRSRVVTLATRR